MNPVRRMVAEPSKLPLKFFECGLPTNKYDSLGGRNGQKECHANHSQLKLQRVQWKRRKNLRHEAAVLPILAPAELDGVEVHSEVVGLSHGHHASHYTWSTAVPCREA